MSLQPIPADIQLADKTGRLTPPWQSWLAQVFYWLRPAGNTGTTAQRPTDSSTSPLYVGQSYFDATLGLPVWVKSRGPTVWVNASGATV